MIYLINLIGNIHSAKEKNGLVENIFDVHFPLIMFAVFFQMEYKDQMVLTLQ